MHAAAWNATRMRHHSLGNPQEAAGLYAHLREHEANKLDAPAPVDVSPECCGLMERLMLAQAQVRGQTRAARLR
jgi:hypothetical protein